MALDLVGNKASIPNRQRKMERRIKRLWQSGCNAAYYAVTWRGDCGLPAGMYYHENVHNAFLTAPSLAAQLASLAGPTTVLAHSLGNMVVSSAIQDHGFRPDRFFMLNSAVAAEAFDESVWDDTSLFNPMVHEEWINYPSRTRAGNAGTSDMGWGFSTLGFWDMGSPPMYNPYYVHGVLAMNHVRTARYTPAQAAVATNDSQLVSDPVFRHDLFLGIPSAILSDLERDILLARGVPALSGPMGSRAFGDRIVAKNQDINLLKANFCWPRTEELGFQGWRHSDIKDVALPFVRSVFERILSETAQ